MANKDLSLAHNFQHATAAEYAVNLAGIFPDIPGSYSTLKPKDTVQLVDGKLNGTKQWVSNLGQAKWTMIKVQDQNAISVVMAYLDNSTQTLLRPTVGMEDTVSGNIVFDNTPATRLFDSTDPEFFLVEKQVALGFVTNHLGLCEALYQDIDVYTVQSKINCEFDKKKLKLSISVLQLLCHYYLDNYDQDVSLNEFWLRQKVTLAHAKKTLIDICQFVGQITGSGLYESGSVAHQRYKDALIYSSHMKNLYIMLSEIY